MIQATKFTVEPMWQVVIRDLGINPAEVLKRAGLPLDLFSRKSATLTAPEYFRLWRGLEESAGDPAFPLQIGKNVPVEVFNPPLFAALCSPNLNVALTRLSQFKALCGPMTLTVEEIQEQTCIIMDCCYAEHPMPHSMVATELVLLTQLARLATRETIIPLKVTAIAELPELDRYTDYFGVQLQQSNQNSLVFTAADARRPFLTESNAMWQAFEPKLRQRLTELDAEASFASKVRSALLVLLPSGMHSAEDVARKMAVSKRTLQRRLSDEATAFRIELNQTREGLARHYLMNTELPGAQISFLLGFEAPNSFARAFHGWTGKTPEVIRAESQQ